MTPSPGVSGTVPKTWKGVWVLGSVVVGDVTAGDVVVGGAVVVGGEVVVGAGVVVVGSVVVGAGVVVVASVVGGAGVVVVGSVVGGAGVVVVASVVGGAVVGAAVVMGGSVVGSVVVGAAVVVVGSVVGGGAVVVGGAGVGAAVVAAGASVVGVWDSVVSASAIGVAGSAVAPPVPGPSGSPEHAAAASTDAAINVATTTRPVTALRFTMLKILARPVAPCWSEGGTGSLASGVCGVCAARVRGSIAGGGGSGQAVEVRARLGRPSRLPGPHPCGAARRRVGGCGRRSRPARRRTGGVGCWPPLRGVRARRVASRARWRGLVRVLRPPRRPTLANPCSRQSGAGGGVVRRSRFALPACPRGRAGDG